MVDDEFPAQARSNDQRRDARARAPLVVGSGGSALARRHDVVPLAAELVIGDDDHRVLAAGAVVDRREQLNQVVTAAALACVSGVLVLEPDRLHEADRVEVARLGRVVRKLHELNLVAQVRPPRGAGRIRGVVVERLVVVLEDLVRAVRPGRVRSGGGVGTDGIQAGGAIGPARRPDVTVGVRPSA